MAALDCSEMVKCNEEFFLRIYEGRIMFDPNGHFSSTAH